MYSIYIEHKNQYTVLYIKIYNQYVLYHTVRHGGIIISRAVKGGDSYLRRVAGVHCVYVTSGKRTVRLGSLQGLYYRFRLVQSGRHRHQPHRRKCTTEGHSSVLYAVHSTSIHVCIVQYNEQVLYSVHQYKYIVLDLRSIVLHIY